MGDVVVSEQDNQSLVDGWKVREVFENNNTGFYANLYENSDYCQMVLAYRGSESTLLDFYSKDWQFDIHAIALNKFSGIAGQVVEGFSSMNRSVNIAKENGFTLSFTGHSLGG
ncbi:MAG: hypothetical protein RLN62_07025 [Rickettsiales bacterium]